MLPPLFARRNAAAVKIIAIDDDAQDKELGTLLPTTHNADDVESVIPVGDLKQQILKMSIEP